MSVDTHTQAILLLTAHLGRASQADTKPLSPGEWGRFAAWLHSEGKRPEQLIESGDPRAVLDGWDDRYVTRDRVMALLGRSAALGVVLEKWERAGLWVITRSHSEYPTRMKKRVGAESPPILIGCGARRLLNAPGVAVVGSRDASEDDLKFTWDFGRTIAEGGHIVVSGGARGVDETAMLGCIDAGGKAVGILADSLLRAVTSTKYRNALATDQIALVTPYNPEAGFNVGNAMARNKYIYGCADAAVIIASGKNKGGTWNGAIEAMRGGWVPVWARVTPTSPEGNLALVKRGAIDMGDRSVTPDELAAGQNADSTPTSLFDTPDSSTPTSEPAKEPETQDEQFGCASPLTDVTSRFSMFELFIVKLAECTRESALASADIAASLSISKAQASAWLKAGVEADLVTKLNRPTRYRVTDGAVCRLSDRNGEVATDNAKGGNKA